MRTLLVALTIVATVMLPKGARAATFIVNSTDDGVDTSAPGDGVCATPAHTCTLRAGSAGGFRNFGTATLSHVTFVGNRAGNLSITHKNCLHSSSLLSFL